MAVHPGQPGNLPVLGEEETGQTRRVFLTSSPNEEFFWAVSSISFVIDSGLERRYVSCKEENNSNKGLNCVIKSKTQIFAILRMNKQ